MSRTRNHQDDEAVGSDSFLDILSNIVGILIILVMVAGARVKSFVAESAEKNQAEKRAAPQQLSDARRHAGALAGDVQRLTRDAGRLDMEIHGAEYAREKLGVAVATAEMELERQREALDERQRRRYDAARKLVAARRRLDEIQHAQVSAVSTAPPEVTVTSYPSPISKTVFTKEAHFRLLGGKIVRVPLGELQEKLLDERRQVIWKLEDLPEVSGSIGPIDGFRLDYHIVPTTGHGAMVTAEAVPVAANLGEPLAVALARGSAFRAELERLDRVNTTITLWTYSDSFDEFRTLRKELYLLGFSVAGRPKSKDSHIGVSSGGTRSSAQ